MKHKNLIRACLTAFTAALLLTGCQKEVDTTSASVLTSESASSVPKNEPATAPKKGPIDYSLLEGVSVIEFSGDPDDYYCEDSYGIYESEKYVLLTDKNVSLPGNYVMMLDDITATIEEITGLSFEATVQEFPEVMVATNSGEYPWQTIDTDKLIIQISDTNKYSDGMYWPEIYQGYILMTDNGINTFEGEPVVESDYDRMIDILSSVIFYQYYPVLSKIDRIDESVIYLTIEALEEKYPDFKRMFNDIPFTRFDVEPDSLNIEELYVSGHLDYSTWKQKDAFEELFSDYMFENYGTAYLTETLTKDNSHVHDDREEFADTLKEVFGPDVFVNFVEWIQKNAPELPSEAKLSGNHNDIFTADKNYYLEGDRVFIYVNEGIIIPGDFLKVTDSIVKDLETKMFSSNLDLTYTAFLPTGSPFDAIDNFGKLPIELKIDHDNMCYISYCSGSSVTIYDSCMEDGDTENISYQTIAHEASHAVLGAKESHYKMGDILTEGSADYYAEWVITKHNFPEAKDIYHYEDLDITKDNAEDLFREDYANLTHAERGPQYEYGCYFSRYLAETFGDDFFETACDAIMDAGLKDSYNYGDDEDRALRTKAIKKAFGDDVFVNFAKWYGNNK